MRHFEGRSAVSTGSKRMKILKFGGTSLADPERVRRATRLVREAAGDPGTGVRAMMVVSAFGGVTDGLQAAAAAAARRDKAYRRILSRLTARHREAARELVRRWSARRSAPSRSRSGPKSTG